MPRVVISFDDESGAYFLERAPKGATKEDLEDSEVLVEVPSAFFNDYNRITKRAEAHQDKLTSWYNYASAPCVRGVPRFE